MKDTYTAKVKPLDILDGENMIVVINHQEADHYGINAFDKVEICREKDCFTVDADISTKTIQPGEIGVFKDVMKKYNIKKGDIVNINFTQSENLSTQAIRKKMQGKKISYEEIYSIIKDISENKMTDIMKTYYVASSFAHKTSLEEMYLTAKAMAETGITFTYPKDRIIADKHCIGGVPGNETTMIIIPAIASLGIAIPKNFSKSITSPAATGECVSVLTDISFDKKGIENIVKKNNACLVWGGGLDLAPADDKIIKVSYPLSMQNVAKVVSSIMAKKYAMGITHSLIDIPVGPTAKVPNMKEAKIWKKYFEYVGKKLGMKMSVQITQALQPIGRGIGAVMQVREVLRVLQQHPERPLDLEKKAMYLSAKIIEMTGKAKGKEAEKLAYEQLVNGKAWEKMKEIIKSQNKSKITKNEKMKYAINLGGIDSEKLPLAKLNKKIITKKEGKVSNIDMKYLNSIARILGCPLDNKAGLYLNKKVGEEVKKGEIIFTIYTEDKHKLDTALKRLRQKNIYTIS